MLTRGWRTGTALLAAVGLVSLAALAAAPAPDAAAASADGIQAKVYWSVTRLEQTTNTVHAFLLGHWEASCVQVDGEWRFASLQIKHWLRQEMPWVGDPKARLVKTSDRYKDPGEF